MGWAGGPAQAESSDSMASDLASAVEGEPASRRERSERARNRARDWARGGEGADRQDAQRNWPKTPLSDPRTFLLWLQYSQLSDARRAWSASRCSGHGCKNAKTCIGSFMEGPRLIPISSSQGAGTTITLVLILATRCITPRRHLPSAMESLAAGQA